MRSTATQESAARFRARVIADENAMSVLDDSIRDAMTPLYRAMGAAVHAAQGFEYNLSLLLAHIAYHRQPTEAEIFSASLELHETQTLGNLIHELKRELPDLPDEVGEYLREGLGIRNKLVHGFFPKNSERLMAPKGRLELENELKVIVLELQSRTKIVWSLVEKYLRRHGVTSGALAQEFDELWRALDFQPHGDQPPQTH